MSAGIAGSNQEGAAARHARRWTAAAPPRPSAAWSPTLGGPADFVERPRSLSAQGAGRACGRRRTAGRLCHRHRHPRHRPCRRRARRRPHAARRRDRPCGRHHRPAAGRRGGRPGRAAGASSMRAREDAAEARRRRAVARSALRDRRAESRVRRMHQAVMRRSDPAPDCDKHRYCTSSSAPFSTWYFASRLRKLMPISVPSSALSSSTTACDILDHDAADLQPVDRRAAARVSPLAVLTCVFEVGRREHDADAPRRRQVDRDQRRAGVDHARRPAAVELEIAA